MVVDIKKSIYFKKYKLINPNITKKYLLNLGFRENDESFTYRFPVLRYMKIPTLFGIITVDSEGHVKLDCETPSGNTYVPFYGNEYGDFTKIIEEINKSFIREMNKLYIREVKRNKNGQHSKHSSMQQRL